MLGDRGQGPGARWGELGRDLNYAGRRLRRSPGFTAAATITLALGIGANTAIFSVIDDTLFRPLAVPHADRITAVYNFDRKTAKYVSSSYPDYEDFSLRAKSFRQLSAYLRIAPRVTIGEHTEQVPAEAVTANYFDMLELPPVAGRAFRAEDDRPGAAPVAMLGEDFWRERFQGDRAIFGKTILIEDHPFTVASIVPGRYQGNNLDWGQPPKLWIPLGTTPLLLPRWKELDIFHNRQVPWLLMLGRLKNGIGVPQAQAELQTLAANIAQAEPATNRDITALAFAASRARFYPAYRESVTRLLSVFAAAAALVLLLACANVSNLLLERALSRRREIAIRLAIGAARGRLVRQLLTENSLLIVPSFIAALGAAYGLEKILAGLPNALGMSALDLTLDARALGFCAAVSLVATALFGLVPAIQASRSDVLPALKDSGNASPAPGHDWLRHSLVVVQVALSTILLVGGGLFARSLMKAYSIDLGFRRENLLTMSFDLPAEKYPAERRQELFQNLLRQVSSTPGVQSAAVAALVPLSGVHYVGLKVSDADQASEPFQVDYNVIGPAFFETTGIALISGREFTSHDDVHSAKVAIVNQTLARRLWGGANSVGQTIRLVPAPGAPDRETLAEIVGVARDSKYRSVWEEPQPYVYLPSSQQPRDRSWNLMVRTRVKPEGLIPAMRREWDRMVPGVPLNSIATGDQRVNASLAPQRLAAGLLAAFGALAIILASVGLYSVMACSVVQRRREIGIRIALGARPGVVVRQILGRAFLLTAGGLVLGAAASAAAMRLIASQVKDVSPYDGVTFGVAALLLAAMSASAALIPALRAARIDPLTALKCE